MTPVEQKSPAVAASLEDTAHGLEADAASPLEHEVVLLPIRTLAPADSPRVRGECEEHARTLAELCAPLPPIVVHRVTGRVVDGMHRVRAAVLRGRTCIEARYFDGSEEDAFLLSVRLNACHGLPLSPVDRTAAAARIIASHPQWSDRRIASAAGLSAKSVAAIRNRSTGEGPQLYARIGQDGRLRPVSPAQGRLLAGKIMTDNPRATLREVAQAAGIAVATARDVRLRVLQGKDVLPPKLRRAEGRTERQDQTPLPQDGARNGSAELPADCAGGRSADSAVSLVTLRSLRKDPALSLSEAGRRLLQLLSAHPTQPDQWHDLIDGVPLHRRDAVTQLARIRAQEWLRFAQELESRHGG